MSETDPQGEINSRRVRYEWNSNPQKYQCPAHSILHKAKQAQPPLSPPSIFSGRKSALWDVISKFSEMYFDKGNAIVYQGVQKFQSTNTLGFATLFVLFVCYHCVITPPSATSRLLLKRIKPIFSQRILKIENWISNTVVFAKVWPYCWLCITQRLLWPKSLFVTHSHHDHYVHTASRSLLFTILIFQ